MTDQAPEEAHEDRPAATATSKRRRKRTVKKTESVAASTGQSTPEPATTKEPVTVPNDDSTPAPEVEKEPDAEPLSEDDTAAAAVPSNSDEVTSNSAAEPAEEPVTVVYDDIEPEALTESHDTEAPLAPERPADDDHHTHEQPPSKAWRHESADRAWPRLGDYPEPPATAAWTGTAGTAWPSPTTRDEELTADTVPAPPKRRELGRREAGLALAFLALGVASGVTIGSNATVPLAPPAVVSHEATFERTIADAQQRTVTIAVDSSDGVASRGAGTVIGKDGTVVTTNAVVRSPSGTVRVTTFDGRTLTGEFVGTDQTTGLTVLRVRGLDVAGFSATSGDAAAGTRVAVIGQNNNSAATAVASPRQSVNTITGNVGVGTWTSAVRLTADDDPTATGGPIINDSGALVGIAVSGVTTGRDSDPERRQYGIDAGIAVTVARNVATTGVALHGRIGAEVSDEEAGVLGARITDVADASPAKTAGLRDGDIIVSYNGSRIGSAAQLVAAVRGTDPGTKADVAFLRDGHERTVRVQITASQ
jgi:putative serine protease PepD